jgi:DNA-binding transcriptional LysR family regulator
MVIQKMDMTTKDLNLLQLFNVLMQEHNLTRAAQRLSLSQPALSHKLKKLRTEFDDELFVRASKGLTPTPRAIELADEIAKIVGDMEKFYFSLTRKDFLSSTDKITIYGTDYIEYLLLPKLLQKIDKLAPNIRVVMLNTQGRVPIKELENGECDIAIAGFYQDMPGHIYQQTLRYDEFVVLACKENTKILNNMDINDYINNKHIVATLSGDLKGSIDNQLEVQLGYKRNVVAGLSSFLNPSESIVGSQYIHTCFRPIAERAIKITPELNIYPLPFKIPSVQIKQIWHQRTNQDPLRKWLRNEIKLILSPYLL